MKILCYSDGYTIEQIATSDDIQVLQKQMQQEYTKRIPSDWIDGFKEISSLNEETAVLYDNGNNVYVWHILNANQNNPTENHSTFNAKQVKNEIIQSIRDFFKENGPNCNAIIGISGGKDSTIVAALCVEALGADRVIGVTIPQGTQKDIDDAYLVIHTLGMRHIEINIETAYQSIYNQIYAQTNTWEKQASYNLPPRLRMACLYAVSQNGFNGRVMNTSNYSEDFVGYATRYGDTAGDFAPIGRLTVRELKEIGKLICQTTNLPYQLIEKEPADGLTGKSDEEMLGFTYDELDDFIMYNKKPTPEKLDKIMELHKKNLFKLKEIPAYEYRKPTYDVTPH